MDFYGPIIIISGSISTDGEIVSGSSQIDIGQTSGYATFSSSVSSDTIYRLYQPDKSNPFVYADNSGSLRIDGNIILGESYSIVIDKDISADEKWTGVSIDGTAGTTLTVGDLCYLDATAGEWLLSDADAASTSGPVVLGMCILAANNAEATKLLLNGTIRSAAFPASITLGAPLYVSPTAGDITVTAPSTATQIVRIVGWAVTVEPNTIYFAPDTSWIEI